VYRDNDPVNPGHLRNPPPLTSFDEWLNFYGMRSPSERLRSCNLGGHGWNKMLKLFARVSVQQESTKNILIN
jgi:hypothetical protein